MKTLLLASALFAGLFVSLTAVPIPVPYHAFCKTLWLFAVPCNEINTKVVAQILAFSPQYRSQSYFTRHLDPEGENITFALNPTILTAGCRVFAQSTSIGFTSLLDGGLNYCNLYNLLSASGLISSPDFMEMTNEWACLGYGLASYNQTDKTDLTHQYSAASSSSSTSSPSLARGPISIQLSQKHHCSPGGRNLLRIKMKTLLLASALFAGLFVSLAAVPVPDPAPAPYHAFCKTMLFAGPCTDIKTMLVTQILASSPEYTSSLVLSKPTTRPRRPPKERASSSHLTPPLTGGCRMSALSTSNGFTSLFDGGQNYCNLYNLVSASGLMKEPGFMEITNEWACLGYGLATCS
ncbi:hypothetical protein NQZ68_001420 [Dissostichus eleginoides]|nr:hypothetical protein NQZ68_001420 [Dissostichus eleginoides]